jgi:hypothetical protein
MPKSTRASLGCLVHLAERHSKPITRELSHQKWPVSSTRIERQLRRYPILILGILLLVRQAGFFSHPDPERVADCALLNYVCDNRFITRHVPSSCLRLCVGVFTARYLSVCSGPVDLNETVGPERSAALCEGGHLGVPLQIYEACEWLLPYVYNQGRPPSAGALREIFRANPPIFVEGIVRSSSGTANVTA